MKKDGSIVCVGLGMVLGAHLSPLTRQFIVEADVVFTGVTNEISEQWLLSLNAKAVSLQTFYQEGKDRRVSYRQMVDAMLDQVRLGKKVVAAFYGHPGVFAWAPHQVIKEARAEGYHAHMEPGISAEDCLYADMAIDPGTQGIVHQEASQFLLYHRHVDSAAYLILWQIGFVGDLSMGRYSTDEGYRDVLQNVLCEHYSDHHQVAIYEAATLPHESARITWIALDEFAKSEVEHHSTLVIPPSKKRQIDLEMQTKLQQLNFPTPSEIKK